MNTAVQVAALRITGCHYPPGSAAGRTAELAVADDGALWLDPPGCALGHWRSLRVPERLGRAPRVLRLADGGAFETGDNAAVDACERRFRGRVAGGRLHALEGRWSIALAALLALGLATVAGFVWGIPALAARVAPWLPVSIVTSSSEQTLASLDAHLLAPSRLSADRCEQLEAVRARLAVRVGTPRGRLECRHGGALGANAFALPSGLIVMTDELVVLAGDDDELAGILAHEVAHVEYRHGLRQALQGSLLTLGAALLTGDLANAGSFVAHLPVVLAGLHYSRDFEREADARAVALLRAEGRDPRALARALDRLEAAHGAAGREAPPAWLSDHPDTRERIARIEAAAR